MSFIVILIELIVFGAMCIGLHQKNTNRFSKSKKRFDGKTVLVTGGTSGMGLEIATDFACRGARVIVACPFVDEGTRGEKVIIERSGNQNVAFKVLDLASLDSVRKFAADIINTEDRLDILINNAGIAPHSDFKTADGLNFVMQVNYFGTFLLTILLLPLLIKTGSPSEPSKIANVSSILHRLGQIDLENINRTNYWYRLQLYCNSKLWLVMFGRELSRRLKDSNVIVNNVDPGVVGTNIFQSLNIGIGAFLTYIFGILFKRPYEGAQTAIYVSTSETAGKFSGEYFQNCVLSKASDKVYNDDLLKKVWNESLKLVGINNEECEEYFKSL